MYCNSAKDTADISQSKINIRGEIYSCANNLITVSCPKKESSWFPGDCVEETIFCEKFLNENVYCTRGTLYGRKSYVCNSTTIINETNTTILNCYQGQLPEKMASSIPTTTTEAPITTTTEKELSLGAYVHTFLMHLVGEGHVVENKPTITTTMSPEDDPRFGLKEGETPWIPEALTIPVTTTKDPRSEIDEMFQSGLKIFEMFQKDLNGEEVKVEPREEAFLKEIGFSWPMLQLKKPTKKPEILPMDYGLDNTDKFEDLFYTNYE